MKEKPYKTVEARKTYSDGGWVEVVEVEGHVYKVCLMCGEPAKNPFNGQWGHKWYAVLIDPVSGSRLVKVRVDRGVGMLKALRLLGVLY